MTSVGERARRQTFGSFVIAVFVMAMFSPGAASATTGAITSATATADWTYGNFSGSVTYDLCASRVECKWSAILTVQPTTYACDGNDPLPSGDRNVQIAWATGPHSVDSTVPFDRQNWPIIRGVYGQRLCLYIWEQGKIEEPNPFCDFVPPPCDPTLIRDLYFFNTVASRIMTVIAPPPTTVFVPTPGPSTSTGGQPTGAPIAALSRTRALSAARNALKKRYGRAYRRGKRKRLSCTRAGEKFRCSFSFRYRRKTRKGTVTVRSTPDGLKTSLKPKR